METCDCGELLPTKNVKKRHQKVCPLLGDNNNLAESKVTRAGLVLVLVLNSSFKTVHLIDKSMALVCSCDRPYSTLYPCENCAMGICNEGE